VDLESRFYRDGQVDAVTQSLEVTLGADGLVDVPATRSPPRAGARTKLIGRTLREGDVAVGKADGTSFGKSHASTRRLPPRSPRCTCARQRDKLSGA